MCVPLSVYVPQHFHKALPTHTPGLKHCRWDKIWFTLLMLHPVTTHSKIQSLVILRNDKLGLILMVNKNMVLSSPLRKLRIRWSCSVASRFFPSFQDLNNRNITRTHSSCTQSSQLKLSPLNSLKRSGTCWFPQSQLTNSLGSLRRKKSCFLIH